MDIWNGEDIYISYNGKVLFIAEGTGDNLLPEDEAEGYVDYFNLEVYNENPDTDLEDYDDTIGGGFMMRKKYIAEEFYGRTVDEVITEVFACNGETDAFDLYATEKPEYKILR